MNRVSGSLGSNPSDSAERTHQKVKSPRTGVKDDGMPAEEQWPNGKAPVSKTGESLKRG